MLCFHKYSEVLQQTLSFGLGDDTENSAKSILGLNEYSTILAYEDITN